MAKTFEDILQAELVRPVRRSRKFYEAAVLLGAAPGQVAPHLRLPEAEVAGELAEARGRIAPSPPAACGRLPGGPSPVRSNWCVRCR